MRTSGVTIVSVGVIFALLYWARPVFITFFSAVTIAFMLEPFVSLLMRLRLPRSVASFVVCSIALLVIYLAGLGLYTQISALLNDMPKYSQRIEDLVYAGQQNVERTERSLYRIVFPGRERERLKQEQAQKEQAEAAKQRKRRSAEPPALPPLPSIQEVRIQPERSPIMNYLYARLGSVYEFLLMASFVPFLVYFMLSWRDHVHRSFLQFFEGTDRMVATKSLQGVAGMVRAFVVGNFVLGLLLAGVSSFLFWKFRLPFPLLIGPLSGFLSMFPYIGLPLALIPPLFFAITVFNNIGAYLMIAASVTLLHVLALNLLYPKLVGSRVHLNPLVVTVALMVFGFLWDAAGLVLAIPLTAGLKAVCDNVRGLRPYGKFLGD